MTDFDHFISSDLQIKERDKSIIEKSSVQKVERLTTGFCLETTVKGKLLQKLRSIWNFLELADDAAFQPKNKSIFSNMEKKQYYDKKR